MKPKQNLKINPFGASGEYLREHLMPTYDSIPDRFKNHNSNDPYVKLQRKWFFEGLTQEEAPKLLKPKEGIVLKDALNHLYMIQHSWECKHEHKEAAVAYLLYLWFEEPKL